jgi:hypothetical protein
MTAIEGDHYINVVMDIVGGRAEARRPLWIVKGRRQLLEPFSRS